MYIFRLRIVTQICLAKRSYQVAVNYLRTVSPLCAWGQAQQVTYPSVLPGLPGVQHLRCGAAKVAQLELASRANQNVLHLPRGNAELS
jgi:hypothetical protein